MPLGIAKIKETNKNIGAIEEQLEALKKDVITRRITAEAAKENAKTLGERLIKEMEVKGQELELQEKRMILDAIKGGVDSILKFGFLKKKGGKYRVIQEKRFKVKEEEWMVDEEKLYEMFTKQTEMISKCLNEIKV